jgi:hypothetical protein
MAEETTKQKEMDLGPFTAEERAYFDSKGEKDIPAATPPTGEPTPAQAPAEPAAAAEPVPTSPEKQREVPQQALHEERKRRQDAEEKARNLELLNARMEERFRMFAEATKPQPQAPRPVPSPDQDIFGAVKHMQQEQRATRAEIDQYKRQIQQEDQLKALRNWGGNQEREFHKANPDYYDALNHLRAARGRELAVWGMTPEQISQQLGNEENQLLARAANERRDPAKMAYDLAHQRGYQKKAPAPTDGRAKHEVDLNRIEAAQRQSTSLSGVGGNTGRDVGDIEVEDLLKMSDKEFGAFIEKYPGRFRRLKGAAH